MDQSPAALTDPARELADLCERLVRAKDHLEGAKALGELMGLEPWSEEFYQVIFSILRRIRELRALLIHTDLDADLREAADDHLNRISLAFGQAGLNSAWSASIANYISPANVAPIKMLSSVVRRVQAYPRLSADEQAELVGQVVDLISWLKEHQLVECDFIRTALIDGLERFLTSLQRLQWLGWGYTVQSLRDVIGAYMALERALPDPSIDPTAMAMFNKTGELIASTFAKLKVAKDVYQVGDLALKAYAAISLVIQAHGVAGLLTYGS